MVPDPDDLCVAELTHHHCPAVTWCENGDLLAVWFATRSEIGREMVILSSRLRSGSGQWDASRLFFSAADRNMTGSNLLNDGAGGLFFFNAISESSHHKDQCMVQCRSRDNGREWTRPRIISDLDNRHKVTPMASSFMRSDGTLVLTVDYAPIGYRSNEAGSGVFLSRDGGRCWIDRISGKEPPEIAAGKKGGMIAGLHANVVELGDGRFLALSRGGSIDGCVTCSISDDEGESWTYSRTEFPAIGSGQRLVLLRLTEGPLLFVSFTDTRKEQRKCGMIFEDGSGGSFKGYGMFAALSFDDGENWTVRKLLTMGGKSREADGGGNTGIFQADAQHAEPAGYLAAVQTPDGLIHLLSSRWHYRFNLEWLTTA